MKNCSVQYLSLDVFMFESEVQVINYLQFFFSYVNCTVFNVNINDYSNS